MVNNGFIHARHHQLALSCSPQLFSNVAYTFLPILIAISAAKVFGGNPFLGAVIGMIMLHPNLQNAWTVATEGVHTYQEVFFGLYEVPLVGYQGHVIPVIIAVWLMSFLEKQPAQESCRPMFDLFVTPLVTVFVTGYLTLAAHRPGVHHRREPCHRRRAVADRHSARHRLVHHGRPVRDDRRFRHPPYVYHHRPRPAQRLRPDLLAAAGQRRRTSRRAARRSQLRSGLENKKLKTMALPASLSAFMGITEPAIFGVNLRFCPAVHRRVRSAAACGALYASVVGLGATGTGVTGIFGILLHLHHPIQYIITIAIATGVAFVISWFFGLPKEEQQPKEVSAPAQPTEQPAPAAVVAPQEGAVSLVSPLTGEAVPLSETGDPAFAAEALGKGIAVKPSEGKVFAPCDATVSAVMGHAVGLECDNGAELLIHVGIDTVNLDGRHYTGHVEDGQRVKAGDLLLEFDIAAIEKEGYKTITPVIVTNSDDYADAQRVTGAVHACKDMLMTLKR